MSPRFRLRLADLTAILLSILLALVIWVNANQTEDPIERRALQIEVDFINQPDDVRIIQPTNLNPNVLIAYEGPTSILNELTTDDFLATVDLSQIEPGLEQLVPIVVQSDTMGIELDPPAPSEISVHLERLVARDIPVELELRGSIPRGYVAEEALVDPPFVNVEGLASDVNSLASARVSVFLGNDDTETKLVTPQPIFYNRQGRVASVSGMTLSTNQISVTIPINEAEDFTNKVISVDVDGEPATGYRVLNVTVDPPSVLVTGPPSLLERPFRVETEPIDVTGLTESFETRVSINLPNGITLDELQEIVATIEIEPFSSTKVFNRPVELLGVAEDLEATIDPENVRVVLFGPLPTLDSLPEQDVEVSLDLFGLAVGTYDMEPAVTIPERGLEIRTIQPALVTVSITRPVPMTNTLTNTVTTTLPLTATSSIRLFDGGAAATPAAAAGLSSVAFDRSYAAFPKRT